MQKHVNKPYFNYISNSHYGVFGIARELPTPTPTKVIYNGNKTIVIWDDGDKTIVSCGDDEEFDNYTGFLAALAKKLYGSTSRAKKMVRRVTDDQRKPKPQKPQKTQKPQKPQEPVDWLAEIEAEIDKYIEDVAGGF